MQDREEPMNLLELTKEKGLKTEEDCIATLEKMRWPDGIGCPACGNQKISRLTRATFRLPETCRDRSHSN